MEKEDKRTALRKIGDAGEDAAAKFLEENGYRIIERNFSCKLGEIDIIAFLPGSRLISFVEVKTRKNTLYGYPCEFVNKEKRRKLKLCANYYLLKNPRYRKCNQSMDVFEVIRSDGKLYGRHIRNAF